MITFFNTHVRLPLAIRKLRKVQDGKKEWTTGCMKAFINLSQIADGRLAGSARARTLAKNARREFYPLAAEMVVATYPCTAIGKPMPAIDRERRMNALLDKIEEVFENCRENTDILMSVGILGNAADRIGIDEAGLNTLVDEILNIRRGNLFENERLHLHFKLLGTAIVACTNIISDVYEAIDFLKGVMRLCRNRADFALSIAASACCNNFKPNEIHDLLRISREIFPLAEEKKIDIHTELGQKVVMQFEILNFIVQKPGMTFERAKAELEALNRTILTNH